MRHRTKFREDRSKRSGDMADFRFFKMAAGTTPSTYVRMYVCEFFRIFFSTTSW